MSEFNVGEYVRVQPDFSNDGFEPFYGQVVEVDAPTDPNPIYYVKDINGDVEPWMAGNIVSTEQPQTYRGPDGSIMGRHIPHALLPFFARN